MNKRSIVSALILSFVTSFMLFIFEPINMYANNINDFWFDLGVLIGPTSVAFLVCWVIMFALFIGIYFLARHLKKEKLFQYTFLFVFWCFLCAYIHSNFLAGMLPSLDGEFINWNDLVPNLVSIVVCLVSAATIIICCKKLSVKKMVKYSTYVSAAIFAMLSVSLISTFISNNSVFTQKGNVYYATNKNIDTASKNKNFMIFVVDAVDSRTFNDVISSNEEYKQVFADFTYYPDTMSAYPFTRDSIPFILTGEWNENKTDFPTYSTNALNNSKLINNLISENYQANLFEDELVWNDDNAGKISNMRAVGSDMNIMKFVKQESKYILFKNLPYPLKRFSKIENMDFNSLKENAFSMNNMNFINQLTKNPKLNLINENYFQFIHIEGGHVPFNLDENLNQIEEGAYPQKLAGVTNIIDKYLTRLKENQVYDNSAIIIMSDHGYNFKDDGRQNPILFIKGINERHDKMRTSNKTISYADLNDCYDGLLMGKNSGEIFENINNQRSRRYLWYIYTEEDHMVEQEQTGKAWELGSLKPTGKEFNR